MVNNVSFGKVQNTKSVSNPENEIKTEKTSEQKKNGKAKIAATLIGLAAIGAAGVYAVSTGKVSALKDGLKTGKNTNSINKMSKNELNEACKEAKSLLAEADRLLGIS